MTPNPKTVAAPVKSARGCIIAFLVVVGVAAFCFILFQKKAEAAKKQVAENIQSSRTRREEFATRNGATWPEVFHDEHGKMLLAVDLQRRLLPGTPVVLKVSSANVRAEGSRLILMGELSFAAVDVEIELSTDESGLNVVRTHRDKTILVVAQLDSVNPRRDRRKDETGGSEDVGFVATGRAISIFGTE
jgi:hypothetical protein